MKTCYVDKTHNAIADLDAQGSDTYMLTRINTPRQHRGKGVARALLRRVLDDADAEGITLVLGIVPSGGLSYIQLRDWYKRHGFRKSADGGDYYYRRLPLNAANSRKETVHGQESEAADSE
jgi:predicted GNAT family acetyltransferase